MKRAGKHPSGGDRRLIVFAFIRKPDGGFEQLVNAERSIEKIRAAEREGIIDAEESAEYRKAVRQLVVRLGVAPPGDYVPEIKRAA